MSRRRRAEKRRVAADPIYNSELAAKFINKMMYGGNKTVAATLFYGAIDKLSESAPDKNGFVLFETAIRNVKPLNEVKSRRIGGSNYQVPVKVRNDRQVSLAIRWIIGESRRRKEKNYSLRLAAELKDAANGVGATMKKRENVHKMADANKAFSHFKF
ncbi:MAG: 30S ribosomal protein S7 [Candidatus Cloacimonetes bacterium]|nr:30S ribosomal protein S7 [Candidatus Cloacimonadota bacterium]